MAGVLVALLPHHHLSPPQERIAAAALLLVGLRPSAAGSALPAYAAAARLRFGVR